MSYSDTGYPLKSLWRSRENSAEIIIGVSDRSLLLQSTNYKGSLQRQTAPQGPLSLFENTPFSWTRSCRRTDRSTRRKLSCLLYTTLTSCRLSQTKIQRPKKAPSYTWNIQSAGPPLKALARMICASTSSVIEYSNFVGPTAPLQKGPPTEYRSHLPLVKSYATFVQTFNTASTTIED